MHPTIRYLSIVLALAMASAAPGLAQGGAIRKNHFSVDLGLLQGGLSYARRVGDGRFSFGGGVWGAWEPWDSFEGSVFQPMGAELFVRAHPSRAGVRQGGDREDCTQKRTQALGDPPILHRSDLA